MREKRQYLPSEALHILGNGLYELRLLTKYTQSMYTNDLSSVDKKLGVSLDKKSNAYFTLNQLNPALHSRPQSEHFLSDKSLKTTADSDVIAYRWILVDLDPVRPSDVSSSDEEKNKAYALSRKIFKSLKEFGVPESSVVVADSGNGYHILIRVDFETSKENVEMVKSFLSTLDFYFSDDSIHVDVKNFNPSRITKLYGTYSRKGMSTTERPHRLSNLLYVPDEIQVCDKELIKKISQMHQPEKESHIPSTHYNANFDANQFIDEFIKKHGINVIKDTVSGGVRRMVLDECPFNSSHKHDSMIGVADNKPFFSCFHNSCSGNHWREYRLLYEPNFEAEREERQRQYEQSKNQSNEQQSKTRKEYNRKVNVVDIVEKITAKSDKVKKEDSSKSKLDETKDFFTLLDGLDAINSDDEVEQGFSTGFSELDKYLDGGILSKGTFSIISGDNSSGKSTFVNQMVLNIANQGYKSMVYSGELTIKRFTKWMLRQACGSDNMRKSQKGNYYVPDDAAKKIAEWASDKIYLYNNKKSQRVSDITKKIIQCIEEKGVELIVIDNLMSMETSELGNDFGTDKQIIQATINIAKSYNVHIILIAHPRKSNGYLRKNDICGEKNIANLADNIFIMHRVNDDFIRSYYEYKKGKKWYEGCQTGFEEYGNVLEICKNRDNGKAVDQKIPFYFDVDCSRFMETQNEHKTYGWKKESDISYSMAYMDDLPFD